MQYCAFLRGVNVRGTNMKMQEVCTVFENAGMQNVVSAIASGNIIFSSDKKMTELKKLLEAAMSKTFDYEASLFLLTSEDCKQIFEGNPFSIEKEMHTYVFIGIKDIETKLMEAFKKATPFQNEKAVINNGYFYWQIAKGETLGSEFSKVLGKKNMKTLFTSRNINTIEKILNKMQ